MNSKELVLKALYNGEVDRVPWVPFVGCHAAYLTDTTCEAYFKSADEIVKGVTKSYELYRPDGLPTLFDLQVEAEAMGCELQYSDVNPPCVATHPLEQGVALEDLKIPTEEDGRFPVVLDATRRLCAELGDEIAMYGLITGPFTLALHLQGTEIFYDMIGEPEKTHKLLKLCQEVGIQTAKMYIDAGVDIIAIVDPMVSQISPDHFREFVKPYVQAIFDYVKSRGKGGSMFVCGDATRNLEEMCQCGAHNISIDENVSLQYAKELCLKYGISLGGNIQLTVTMLFGSPIDCINDAKNCMQIGGMKGFILAPGCDLPYSTPIENIKAVTSLVHDEVTDVLESAGALEGIEVTLPNYPQEKKVILDVITLDSSSCAPCQYMVEAVKAAMEGMEDQVEWTEYKIKEKESVVRMIKLGVKNIPTVCIDGDPKYVSIIPSVETLREAIQSAINMKR